MTNATVRANARPMPKPKPGSAASIRRQTADLKSATTLLKAAKVIERELEDENMEAFSRAYARWLRARAAIKGADFPEDGGAAANLFAEERAALRELFSRPAAYSEDVFQKFEALEAEIADEGVIGRATDTVLPLALGSVKTDLLRLGIGRAA
jgi:hypothetical protein